jgi:hypothetical protein
VQADSKEQDEQNTEEKARHGRPSESQHRQQAIEQGVLVDRREDARRKTNQDRDDQCIEGQQARRLGAAQQRLRHRLLQKERLPEIEPNRLR